MKKRFKKIYIEITNICNLSCSFCEPTIRKKEFMSEENYIHILDEISKYTNHICLHVKGEPLMHPEINKFIEIASNKGFLINITTNGLLLKNLKNQNIRQLNYSIQSSNNPNEIKNIIKNIKMYIKDTNIYVSLRLWSKLGNENQEIINILKDEFNIDKNIILIDKMKLDKNIFLSIEKEFKWPNINYMVENNIGTCYALRDHIAILVDGTVVPCCLDNNGDIFLGNILKQEFDKILENKKIEIMIKGFQNLKKTEKLCKNCNFYERFNKN